MIDGTWNCNIWQGRFPESNDADDGFVLTAPAAHYRPNAYGLYQTVGNVWEWCDDWYSPDYYAVSPERSPHGPASGVQRVLRGGSFLCHDSYCNRYRNSARSQNTADSAMSNTGFRTVDGTAPVQETSTAMEATMQADHGCCSPTRDAAIPLALTRASQPRQGHEAT
jgi:formylglycine-generating enzyme required for sulfatase activity